MWILEYKYRIAGLGEKQDESNIEQVVQLFDIIYKSKFARIWTQTVTACETQRSAKNNESHVGI